MRKYIMSLLFVFASFVAAAQTATKTEPAGSGRPAGSTRTTSVSTDESLNKVVTIETKDKQGIVMQRTIFKKDLANNWTYESVELSPSGKTLFKIEVYLNTDGKIIKTVCTDNKYSFQKITKVRNNTGELVNENDPNDYTKKEDVSRTEDIFRSNINKIEKETIPSLEPVKSACGQSGGDSKCSAKIQIYGGYSYLRGDFGNDKESFPVGFQAIALFNVSEHINTGINISYHKKTDGDITFSRTFVMAEGQYMFGDVNDCNRKIRPDMHVLFGWGSERIKYNIGSISNTNSGSGFAFGAGGGLNIRLNSKIGLGIQTDWLGIKFKNSDEINSNVRVSAGATFWIGRRYYKNPYLQTK